MDEIRLITLDPGHFHAALVQKEMYPDVSPRVAVYGPLGPDLIAHLNRISQFNNLPVNPTRWELDVHALPCFFDRMLQDRPGNVVVLAGRNRGKIDHIARSVEAGCHVLADKPWIISPYDLERVEQTLDTAERNGLIVYDIMTERYEVTSVLQRELVNDSAVFGEIRRGSPEEPAVYMESVHHIMKLVAGKPLVRPPWFFDIGEQGEGLTDVGPHLVDLAQWTLASGQVIDYRTDVQVLGGERWPTVLTGDEYREVTGDSAFPSTLAAWLEDGKLHYFCNNRVSYTLKGVHVKLDALWNYRAPEGGGDTHFAVYRGSQSRIEVRQGAAESYQPELYVVPEAADIGRALRSKLASLQTDWPGVGLEQRGKEYRVTIPAEYRVGHEAHFAQVARQFLRYLHQDEPMPTWEKPNMLAKYYVTTSGVR